MASGNDWLMTLLGGVGGGFTGAGVARQRRMTEEERAQEMALRQRQGAMGNFSAQLQQRAQLDELGYRPEGAQTPPTFRRLTAGLGPASAVPVEAIESAFRASGPRIQTPQGETFVQDRMATPEARRMQSQGLQRQDARAEVERRARERREDAAQRLTEIREQNKGRVDAVEARGSAPYKMTPGQQEQMIKIDQTLALLDRASAQQDAATEAGVRATGRIGGVVPLPVWARLQFNVGGEMGRDLITLIGDLTSQVGNMRSGGAITPQEFERLESFLPTPNDKPELVATKLKNFQQTLQEIRRIRLEAIQRYGTPSATPWSGDGTADAAFSALERFNLPFPD